MERKERPLLSGDEAWVWEKEDLVTLKPSRDNAWLDGFIEQVLHKLHCKAIQVRPSRMRVGYKD